jgi:hypothetical protein
MTLTRVFVYIYFMLHKLCKLQYTSLQVPRGYAALAPETPWSNAELCSATIFRDLPTWYPLRRDEVNLKLLFLPIRR